MDLFYKFNQNQTQFQNHYQIEKLKKHILDLADKMIKARNDKFYVQKYSQLLTTFES
jgi:hypothetical protein